MSAPEPSRFPRTAWAKSAAQLPALPPPPPRAVADFLHLSHLRRPPDCSEALPLFLTAPSALLHPPRSLQNPSSDHRWQTVENESGRPLVKIRRHHCPFDYARRAESATLLLFDPELHRLTIQSHSTWSSIGVPAHRSRQSNVRSLVGSKWPPHRGAVLRTASPLRAPPLSLPARARPLGSVVREVDSIRVS